MKKIRITIAKASSRIKQAEARAESAEARTEQAKTRIELAETRTEQAKARTERAETRTEQAETRTEQAKTRAEQAETRTEQAETALKMAAHNEIRLNPESPARRLDGLYSDEPVDDKNPLESLTRRQREILRLIAEGFTTKQIAEMLKVSPKTVEYHRLRLMNCLNVHDIAGLVRLALRVGMVSNGTKPARPAD